MCYSLLHKVCNPCKSGPEKKGKLQPNTVRISALWLPTHITPPATQLWLKIHKSVLVGHPEEVLLLLLSDLFPSLQKKGFSSRKKSVANLSDSHLDSLLSSKMWWEIPAFSTPIVHRSPGSVFELGKLERFMVKWCLATRGGECDAIIYRDIEVWEIGGGGEGDCKKFADWNSIDWLKSAVWK